MNSVDADHQVDARAEHQVDLAHVIRGARHGVAHRLQVVEGHALAEQGDVQLVADIALHALRHQLGAEVAPELQHAAHDLRAAEDERQRDQRAQPPGSACSMPLKAFPTSTGTSGRQRGIPHRADDHDDQDRASSVRACDQIQRTGPRVRTVGLRSKREFGGRS